MNAMITTIRGLCLVAVIGCASQGEAALTWNATAPNVNLPIPDNNPNAGAASDIYIAQGDSQLSGMVNPCVASITSVQFTITGGWDGDYIIVLSHTDGTAAQSVPLLNTLLGGAAANSGFDNVTLAAGNPDINSAGSYSSTAAISGAWAPQGGVNFSSFQNVTPTGDWLLYVTDNAAGDQGILSGWSLNLDVVPEPVTVALAIFGGMTGILAFARSWRAKRLSGGILKC
jgi:hypothetical protein